MLQQELFGEDFRLNDKGTDKVEVEHGEID